MFRSFGEKVLFGTDIGDERSDQFFADGIERRVGNLRKELLEVVIEKLRFFGEHGQRGVDSH